MQHMHDNLTGYKRPKAVEFRDSLPTTNVGRSCAANCATKS